MHERGCSKLPVDMVAGRGLALVLVFAKILLRVSCIDTHASNYGKGMDGQKGRRKEGRWKGRKGKYYFRKGS